MLTVRRAGAGDGPAVAEVHVRTWQEAYRGLIPDEHLDALSIPDRTSGWERMLEDPLQPVWLGERGGEPAGFCTVGPARDDDADDSIGELYAIYVRASAWGGGLGGLLHDEGLAWLRERRYATAVLWVLRQNTRARRFYEKQGWQTDGAEKQEPRRGFVLDEVRYRTQL